MILLKAVILGIVEGVTEFLPISSTGHLIVASSLVNYPEESRTTFDIFIQLGAILAVVWHYRSALGALARDLPRTHQARVLVAQVVFAFMPAAAAGFLFHHAIEERLFSPTVVAFSLILGGVGIILFERHRWHFTVRRIEHMGWGQALWVGLAQVLSLIPGVSRSAATILGGMATGMDRPAATQFSFYLSIPTLCAASVYSLFKARHLLHAADIAPLAVGFVVSFISALIVVRAFISFVQRSTFTGFGYYRILVGALILWLFR